MSKVTVRDVVDFIKQQTDVWAVDDLKKHFNQEIHYQTIRDAINSCPDLRYLYFRSEPYGWRVIRYFAPLGMPDDAFRRVFGGKCPSRAKVRRVGDGARQWERWQL